MSHAHQVKDTDKRFVINPDTKVVSAPASGRPVLAQYDHNAEHITFEISRWVESHDLSKCNKVEIHYNNIEDVEEKRAKHVSYGLYEVTDLRVDPGDNEKVIFTWVISENATLWKGSLEFVVSFVCLTDNDVDYRFNTITNSNLLKVSSGIKNTKTVEGQYADVLEMWKDDLFGIEDTAEANMMALSNSLQQMMESKGNRVLDAIPDDYTALDNKVDEATWVLNAVDNKIPLVCETVLYSPSDMVTASVANDGFNTLFRWKAHSDASYVYTYGLLGTYAEFKNKTIRVLIRNESENSAALDELEILLSAGRDWGNVAKFRPVQIGPIENGATVAIDINLAEQALWENSRAFEDDNNLYFILRDNYVATADNVNVIRFFCMEIDNAKKFKMEKNLTEVYSATVSDESAMAHTAIEAGVRVFKAGSIKTYNNDYDEGFGSWSYNEKNHTARLVVTRRSGMAPNHTGSDGSSYFWTYGLVAINVTRLLGKGAKIYIDLSTTYYNDINRIFEFKYYVGPKRASWTPAYKGPVLFNSNHMVIDLDSIEWTTEPDVSVPVYFAFGYEIKNRPNEEGLCETTMSGIVDAKICYTLPNDGHVIATELEGFDPDEYPKRTEVETLIEGDDPYITCWGDSLTAGGGWTSRLSELTGMTVYNGGTGGENVPTIVARQGSDMILLNNITIPAATTAITLATRATDTGLTTELGNKVTPLLQGGAHVNPCKIGDVLGTLKWTGSNYADINGTWTFTRQTAGDAVTITRPTALRTDFDMNKNAPHLMVIFMGQNGGYNNDVTELIRWHRLMIEHSHAKNVIVLGLSSGSANSRAEYEAAMKKEFGRYFISLREYLSTPIYDTNGKIVNCYGLEDQGLTPTAADLEAIATGTVPSSCLSDTVHYTAGTKTVIGDLIYRRCRDLNIF